MQNKLYTQIKDTQKLSPAFSHTPVQGMFESRSSAVQHKQHNSQQPNLQDWRTVNFALYTVELLEALQIDFCQ